MILSTYIYENTRLLLLSTSKAFPKGLANNSGQVGKHYISHLYGGMNGAVPGQAAQPLPGPGAQRTTVDDWNGDNFDHTGPRLHRRRGDRLPDGEQADLGRPHRRRRASRPGARAWKEWLHKNANSVGGDRHADRGAGLRGELLRPRPDTSRTPGAARCCGSRSTSSDQEVKRHAYTQREGRPAAQAGRRVGDAGRRGRRIPIAVNSHAYGTTRMGNDPDTSRRGQVAASPTRCRTWRSSAGRRSRRARRYNPTHTIESLALAHGRAHRQAFQRDRR